MERGTLRRILLLLMLFTGIALTQSEDLFHKYEQILPRGRIAAITAPTFVPADEAEIDPDTWVLGVVIDGQARAYSLNLLNAHEVVNDRVGDHAIAAVW